MKRTCFSLMLLLFVATTVNAQHAGIPADDCDCCQGNNALFPKLQAMFAVHQTQAQYATYGSCQKGCCQKGCVQKGCVQKGCVQKGCTQKGCVQKGCTQKGCVQKGCVQKGCVQKGCTQKCCQKACVQKVCAPKNCCQKPVCQKPVVQKGCCQKGACQKCSYALPRGLLMNFGLFKRGGKGGKGKGCASGCCGSYGDGIEIHAAPADEIPTPTFNSNPSQSDPNPLQMTSYGRYYE